MFRQAELADKSQRKLAQMYFDHLLARGKANDEHTRRWLSFGGAQQEPELQVPRYYFFQSCHHLFTCTIAAITTINAVTAIAPIANCYYSETARMSFWASRTHSSARL